MIEYFPRQPEYLKISTESSADAVIVKSASDGLTDRHPAHEDDVGSCKPAMKRVP